MRTLLIAVLVLSGGAFFARDLTLHQFGVITTPDTSFLGYVVAWLLLFVSLVCSLALWQVWQRQPAYTTLCYLLGFWWMGIGIGIYVAFGCSFIKSSCARFPATGSGPHRLGFLLVRWVAANKANVPVR